MARKTAKTHDLDADVEKELEDALDFELSADDEVGSVDLDLDIESSMEELEAQISQAADELARETGTRPAAAAAAAAPRAKPESAPSPASKARKPEAAELRPVSRARNRTSFFRRPMTPPKAISAPGADQAARGGIYTGRSRCCPWSGRRRAGPQPPAPAGI